MNSSNSSMPRSTAEALKQIQKQGLSISIIATDNSKTFPVETGSKDTREKPNTVALENIVNTSRSAVATESKPVISQARSIGVASSEKRVSNIHAQNQTVQQALNKSNSVLSTDAKGQNVQRINAPLESINQISSSGSVSQSDKNLNNLGRLSQNSSFAEKKAISKADSNNSNLTETETPKRNISGEAVKNLAGNPRVHNLNFEGKINPNQNRSSLNSSQLDAKMLNNAGRISQNSSTPTLDKNIAGLRSQVQVTELKSPSNQVKIIPIRTHDGRTITPKNAQNAKLTANSRSTPSNTKQNAAALNNVNTNKQQAEKATNKQADISSYVDRSMTNPFRVAATSTKNVQEEKTPKIMRGGGAQFENIYPAAKTLQQSVKTDKAVTQGVKISEISSELHQKPPLLPENSSEPFLSSINTMPSQKTGVKRMGLHTSSPVKRKVMKLVPPRVSEQSDSLSDVNTISSDESPEKDKKAFNLKKLVGTPGLTITPVQQPSTSGTTKKELNFNPKMAVICNHCNALSLNSSVCDTCMKAISPTAIQCQVTPPPPVVFTQKINIEKTMQILYLPTGISGQSPGFQLQQNQKVLKVSPRRGRPKRHMAEPVCYTLSSDDEDAPYESMDDNNAHLLYTNEAEGSKSGHSSNSDNMHEEAFEDGEYPGVTSINYDMNNDEEEEELDEEDEEELDEMEPEREQEIDSEEELEEDMHDFDEEDLEDEEVPPEDDSERVPIYNKFDPSHSVVLKCRSVRIGSYKIHPIQQSELINVTITSKSISFPAPLYPDGKKMINLVLKASEIAQAWAHFGKCLPIIFAFTSRNYGEVVRKMLNLPKSPLYFDPTSEDMKRNKLTFLIDIITEDHRSFMRQVFPGPEKLKEIDQKEANEILVKSTPNRLPDGMGHKVDLSESNKVSSPSGIVTASISTPVSCPNLNKYNFTASVSITKVMPKPAPVIKILTYPPPPSTGGVAINTADLATLEEGEFLNDAILDFYLKYVYYEKLSKHDREKTHIFSSFFYPRLTQKPDRPKPGDGPKSMQVRRHNQVKTWTKHVDIFSKDYIIIPVNQHNHWFLAFICYPGRVPEAPCTVSSTNDQDANKVVINEEGNYEEAQSQDDNSMNSSYEVEEPPDSEDEAAAEIPDSSTHPDGNVIIHEGGHQRKETPCILIFDSLSGPNRWRIATTLREYLEIEWKIRKGTRKIFDKNTMQGFIVKCPQQNNFSDCGLYVLQYVESFFENPIPYFGNPLPDLTNWFTECKINKKRQQIKDLIHDLQKQYQIKQVGVTVRKTNTATVSSPIIASTQTSDNR